MRDLPRFKTTPCKGPIDSQDAVACDNGKMSSLAKHARISDKNVVARPCKPSATNQVLDDIGDPVISDIGSSRPNSTASEGGDFSSEDGDDEDKQCLGHKTNDESSTECSESCRDDDNASSLEDNRVAVVLDPISEENSVANKTSDSG